MPQILKVEVNESSMICASVKDAARGTAVADFGSSSTTYPTGNAATAHSKRHSFDVWDDEDMQIEDDNTNTWGKVWL